MKTGNILVVDDDSEIREIVRVLLASEGYNVTCCEDGIAALKTLEEEDTSFDLMVLDVMMPGLDGYDVCKKIREFSQAPVLFLTAKNRETDLVEGFLAGGDDYMQKPFSYTELIARVGGLIRRYRQYGNQAGTKEANQILFNDYVIDKDHLTVTKNGEELDLTNTEYSILVLLTENRGKVFSLQQIYETIWKDPFLPTSSNTVMVHIRNLREKLKDDDSQEDFIKNKWGRGYFID